MTLVRISKTKMEKEANKFLCCYLLCINLYQFEIQQHGANVICYAPLSINKGVAFKTTAWPSRLTPSSFERRFVSST